MLLDIKKLFTKGTTIGRVEYWRTVYGLLLFPMILVYLAILIPPNNKLYLIAVILALIVLIPYGIIYWTATYRRLNNIFDNTIISIILLVVCFLCMRIFKFARIFNILLVIVPGKKHSENKVSSKLFWSTFPLAVILLYTNQYLGFNRHITSEAMANTLQVKDRIIINIFDKEYHRGDIIIHDTDKKGIVYVKRIVALPGEKVEIKELQDGSHCIYINGKELSEPYVKNVYDYPKLSSMPHATMVVPADSYYVVGDNRGNSFDSRYYGAVKRDIIKGKVSHIWYPLNRRQVFTTPQYSFNESDKTIAYNDSHIKDVETYMAYMQKTMKTNWNPPEFDNSMTTTVMFTIMKDGTITNPKIKTSSGNSEMDNIAIATVRNVAKLPPLPTEIAKQHEKTDVEFTFTYNVKQKTVEK